MYVKHVYKKVCKNLFRDIGRTLLFFQDSSEYERKDFSEINSRIFECKRYVMHVSLI